MAHWRAEGAACHASEGWSLFKTELGQPLLARELLDYCGWQSLDELLESRDQNLDRRLGRALDRLLERRRRCGATDAEMTSGMHRIDRDLGQHCGDTSVRLVIPHPLTHLALGAGARLKDHHHRPFLPSCLAYPSAINVT